MSRIVNSYVLAAVGGFVPRTPDALWTDVVLLVHCDGSDGQTTFTDASLAAHTVTRQNLAKVNQDIKKFGTGSLLLTGSVEGSADYLLATHASDFNVGTNDWCVEGWVYVTANPTTAERGLVSKASGGSVVPFDITLRTDGALGVTVTNFDGSITTGLMVSPTAVDLSAWNHFAVSRNGANIRVFLNGIVQNTYSGFTGGTAGGDNTTDIAIGHSPALSFSLAGSMDEVRFTIGNARYTANFTLPSEMFWSPYVVQQSFRFYNDDGNEAGMTAAAAQDANFAGTSGTNYILRMQLDSTGDVPSTAWRLEYKLSTDTVYVPVLTAAPVLPTHSAVGTGVGSQGDVSPAWPAHLPGDIGVLIIESCGGEAAVLGVPAGFVAFSDSPSFTGSGTAGTRLTAYWCRATSDNMPAPTVTDPGDHVWAIITTVRGCIAEGIPYDVTAADNKAVASTSASAPAVTTTVNNCLIMNLISRDNDSASAAFSAETNASLASIAERNDSGTALGNGGGFVIVTATKAAAGSTGVTTATVTSSINASLTIAFRPQTAPITMSASANITASGQATTARLTAPAGKTTGSFTTGRMWDDENGTDAINIASDFYTELAWSIKMQSPATSGQTYNFRVTQAGAALEYYLQTPSLSL